MSGKLWETFGQERGTLSDHDTDSNYQPWRLVGSHSSTPTKFALVPARHVSPERWRFPYFQTIIQKFDRTTDQLCLMLPASGYIIFMQGRGLDELDELIEQRQVVSVHMFDESIHHPIGNDAPIVTNILVEEQKPF